MEFCKMELPDEFRPITGAVNNGCDTFDIRHNAHLNEMYWSRGNFSAFGL